VSPSCRLVLGYEPEALIGRTLYALINQDDVAQVAQIHAALLEHPVATTVPAVRVPRQDGEELFLECSVRPIQAEGGNVVQAQLAARDVTRRVQAERELDQVHAQLERDAWELGRSNAELEQFAYDVSHDLGEPLRIMSRSAGCLSSRFGDRLDDEGRRLFLTIVDGLDRTQTLISDLLRYSLVAREPVEPEAVDCGRVLREALEIMEDSIAEKDATIEWDELPIVTGYRALLAQVFQNLISNALKFVREGQRPSVQIRAHHEVDAWRFSIEDNGIGIDSAQGERVFEMFRRLHTRDAFAGTGIGLSICRRAVERHGGRIWIASSPGGGSIVSFTIPDLLTANGETGNHHEPGSSQPALADRIGPVEAGHAVS
jgi:PAS domain S-box-containing protein